MKRVKKSLKQFIHFLQVIFLYHQCSRCGAMIREEEELHIHKKYGCELAKEARVPGDV